MAEEKLKPCPFCGGEATHKINDEIITPEMVYCLECAIVLPTELWQKRAGEEDKKDKP